MAISSAATSYSYDTSVMGKTKTSGTTDKGTKIVTSAGGEMDGTAFLKILAAELSNLDPTQDQDSTQYVTQMAQLTTMQQMNDLNKTMTNFADRELIGKAVVLNQTDSKGQYISGYVESVYSNSTGTFVILQGDSENMYPVSSIAMVTDGNENSSYITALNTQFMAASQLSTDSAKVLIQTTDEDGKIAYVKGQAVSAHIDNGSVKLKVNVMDDSGNVTGTINEYSYTDLLKGGKDVTFEELQKTQNSAEESDELNNEYTKAGKLADNESNVLMKVTGDDDTISYVIGKAVNAIKENGKVILRINVMDDEGNLTGSIKGYPYSGFVQIGATPEDIVKAKEQAEGKSDTETDTDE